MLERAAEVHRRAAVNRGLEGGNQPPVCTLQEPSMARGEADEMMQTTFGEDGSSALPPKERAERVLIDRIAQHDRRAFEALYRGYFPRLTRFLENMTRRAQVVDEVLDDTMLVVWRKADTYNGRSKVSTWIFAIAYRKALKALKRLDDPVDFDGAEAAGPADSEPDGELMLQQLRLVLGDAIRQLSAEQRAVIELTYYQGFSCREIADVVGCPVETVKTRMFYARRRLKLLLSERMEDIR
jgi:RNA polymerase sigma-70 factor (ECF subfamily)